MKRKSKRETKDEETSFATLPKRSKLQAHGEAFWDSLFDSDNENDQQQKETYTAKQSRLEKIVVPHPSDHIAGNEASKADLYSDSQEKFEAKSLLEKALHATTKSTEKKESTSAKNRGLPHKNVVDEPQISPLEVSAAVSKSIVKEKTTNKNFKDRKKEEKMFQRTGELRKITTDRSALNKEKQEEIENEKRRIDFNSALRDIYKLVTPHLGKFEKMKIEEDRIMALGAKVLKQRKMPLPELRLRRASAKRAIASQIEKEKELGIKMFHGKTTRFLTQKNKEKHQRKAFEKKDIERSLSMGHVGYETKGVLKLSREFRAKYSNK